MPKVTKEKIIFDADDWMPGFAPQPAVNQFQYLGKGSAFLKAIDPFRFVGYLSPGLVGTDMANIAAVDAVQVNAAVFDVGGASASAYSAGGTKIHGIKLIDTVENDTNWPKTITGATSVKDLIIYKLYGASGSYYVMTSYYNGTNMDIARFSITGEGMLTDATDISENAPDGLKSAYWSVGLGMTSTTWDRPHPMAIGADGLLYIGDGNSLSSIDGTAATPVGALNALPNGLPPEYIITSLVATENFLILFAYKGVTTSGSNFYKGAAKAFFWDYVSKGYTYAYDLNDNYVNGGFIWKGNIGCFTYGRAKGANFNQLAALRLFNGTDFDIVETYPDKAPNHGGVEIADGMIMWTTNGKVYSYGSPFRGIPDSLQHRTSAGGTTDQGLLKNLSQGYVYVSSGIGAGAGLQYLNTQYNSTAIWQSLFAEPIIDSDELAEVTKIVIKHGFTATSGLGSTIQLRTDNTVNSNVTVFGSYQNVTAQTTAESSTSRRMITTIEKDTSGNAFPLFSNCSISISYDSGSANTTAPIYKSIEVYYKRVKRNI